MQCTIDSLTAQISALAANGRGNAGKLYGRKSEKSSRLGKRKDEDDRSSGKDNFDGTPGSAKGSASDGTDNIGSESSAADNAFMYSMIESCKHNDLDPGMYISFLLGKLKTVGKGEDLTGLLPCCCGR